MLLQLTTISYRFENAILNIKRNTLTMQNLINELLEFKKNEQDISKIKIKRT